MHDHHHELANTSRNNGIRSFKLMVVTNGLEPIAERSYAAPLLRLQMRDLHIEAHNVLATLHRSIGRRSGQRHAVTSAASRNIRRSDLLFHGRATAAR
jgi:hypothetical protein